MTPWPGCCGRGVMSEVVETRTLWKMQTREDETYPWTDVGTDRASLPDTMRTYDYWLKVHSDTEVRLLETFVEIVVADPEELRKRLTGEKVEDAVPTWTE